MRWIDFGAARTPLIDADGQCRSGWLIAARDITDRVATEHKARAAVEELRQRFGSVAMVGDGINDAPALRAADAAVRAVHARHALQPREHPRLRHDHLREFVRRRLVEIDAHINDPGFAEAAVHQFRDITRGH